MASNASGNQSDSEMTQDADRDEHTEDEDGGDDPKVLSVD
jgi:hypothetical protein